MRRSNPIRPDPQLYEEPPVTRNLMCPQELLRRGQFRPRQRCPYWIRESHNRWMGRYLTSALRTTSADSSLDGLLQSDASLAPNNKNFKCFCEFPNFDWVSMASSDRLGMRTFRGSMA